MNMQTASTNLPAVCDPDNSLADDFSNAFRLYWQASAKQAQIREHMEAMALLDRQFAAEPPTPRPQPQEISPGQIKVLDAMRSGLRGPAVIISEAIGDMTTDTVRQMIAKLVKLGLVQQSGFQRIHKRKWKIWEAVQ